MKDLSSFVKFLAIAAAAAVTAAYVYYRTRDDEDDSEEKKEKEEVIEKKEEEKPNTLESESSNTMDMIIELLNEISDTMLIVFQHLGAMAIDLTQKGETDEQIYKEIADKFKSTMAVVEKQTCDIHGISSTQYKTLFDKYSSQNDARFKRALYPCRFLLSQIENTDIENPEIPASLTVERVIRINEAITELSMRCMDRILPMLCDEMHVDADQLRKMVSENESLKDQVFDVIVDAEKRSKKKILIDEVVEEADMIVCGLLYKDNELYEKEMERLGELKLKKLEELGLNMR